MEQEQWKDIIGYKGLYQISSFGRVKSVERYVKHSYGGTQFLRERILRPTSKYNHYLRISLCKDAKMMSYDIHRVIALHFIPNPENKEYVNHIDGNKQNNSLENLEWSTPSENQLHAFRTGLKPNVSRVASEICKARVGDKHPCSIKLIDTKTGVIYHSITEAAKKHGVSITLIGYYLKGKLKNKTNLKYFQNEKPIISTIPYSVNRIITNYARPTQLV